MSILVVLPLLGISRLLPAHGLGLWVRLAAATLLLFLPGWYVARALRTPGSAPGFVWSVALAAGALAVTFAVGGSLTLTLGLVLAAGAVALPFSRRSRPGVTRTHGLVALSGIVLGLALWSLEGIVTGDGLFHLGRMRKLDDFGSLSLRAVDEFRDGGLHPGYAFPVWHAWLALVAKIAGVDPTAVLRHESSLLVPLALVLAFEMGRQVFRSTWPALVVLAAQVGMIALAPGSGGSYTTLALPGTTARQLFVPAVIALFFRFVRGPSWPVGLTLAASGMGLAFVHPTYALFVVVPLFGFALVRLLVTTEDLRPSALALTAFGVPVLLVFAWLAPIVGETRSHNPSAKEKAHGFAHYAGDLVISSPSRYHLEPSLVARTGAIAVASLVLVPLAALAARRRWSAFVLGGMVIVLALELAPFLFPRFSDLVSLSQSRRAAGFVPFAIAFAGGAAVLARLLRLLVLPAALAAGILLQLTYPGDFELRSHHGGPALATWIALWGGVAGIAAAAALVRIGGGRYESPRLLGGLAGLLFVLPVAVYGFAHWDEEPQRDAYALTPGLVSFLREHVPERAVVYADLETSYRISAYAPVYVADAPPTHVADTTANRPAVRRRDLLRFLRTGDLAIPRGYGADWLVLGRRELPRLRGRVVYRDARFRVIRL